MGHHLVNSMTTGRIVFTTYNLAHVMLIPRVILFYVFGMFMQMDKDKRKTQHQHKYSCKHNVKDVGYYVYMRYIRDCITKYDPL